MMPIGYRGCTGVDGESFAKSVRRWEGSGLVLALFFFLLLNEAQTMIGHKFAVGRFVDIVRSAKPAPKPIEPHEGIRAHPVGRGAELPNKRCSALPR